MDSNCEISLAEIRDLCARHWNPIGIPMANLAPSSEPRFRRPLPADEYDTYLLHVIRLVGDGASPSQVADYLSTVENEYIQLTSPRGSKDDFVSAVFGLAKRTSTL
ncbi:hypothetical protein NKJ46_28215 [Mesorhizobium sp. M0166]|uniref:hypothetical protein n=1 Tax=unclassified Mesorhizobium TaxID=325217 RepID=UPI00333A4E85